MHPPKGTVLISTPIIRTASPSSDRMVLALQRNMGEYCHFERTSHTAKHESVAMLRR